MKYILVTGGVISGIGKGVIASSTGLLLRTLGLEVTAIKIDPYLNIDAGTLSPLDHGEVFVLNDGGEVDLDLGNYERYLDVILGSHNNITTGKIYSAVIEKERKGDYLGKTVQVVPHITDAIQEWIERVAHVSVDPRTKAIPDVCVIELGGTVGDIESAPFVEALRQFQFRVGQGNFVLVHVSLVPVVGAVGEQKTKPTQSSIRDLRGLGLTPDFIACRCGQDLHESIKQKISMFCHVPPKHVLGVRDCGSVYHVPLLLRAQGLVEMLQEKLNLDGLLKQENLQRGKDLWQQWVALTVQHERLIKTVKIALVGKYTHLQDSYISVKKALEHAGLANGVRVEIEWVEATDLETVSNPADRVKYHRAWQSVCSCQAVLVPGGFGERGHEGKILACQWAREHKVPFLGVCLGMQMAVIEFARNILKWSDAHSEEFDPTTKRPVIIFMPEIDKDKMGGTMRLGKRATAFQPNCAESILYKLYDSKDQVDERHRHRYEVNPAFVEELEKAGLWFVGKDADTGVRMEMFELREHPYYVGTQFHPEYLSRPLRPSPPFFGLVRAAIEQLAAVSAK